MSHVLMDSGESILRDGAEFRGSGGRSPAWRVKLRTCQGGKSHGVHVVEIDNGAMRIDVLPTRGMGIWRVQRAGQTLGWRSPVCELVHPTNVPLTEPAGLGWLAGFNELLCRCGLEGNGPPEFDDAGRLVRPLHGRIANTPAHRVDFVADETAGRILVRGVVDEARFHFQSLRLTSCVSTTIGSNEFTWSDEVENIGANEATLQMLYHFNLGQPLLQPGATIVAPLVAVAPLTQVAANEGIDTWNVIPPPRPGSAEQVYVAELAADDDGDTRVLARGLANDEAVGLRFNTRALPCFTLWRNTPAEAGGYVIGIEPGTNFPNPRSFEQQHGRVVRLEPGESWSAAVTAVWHNDARSIADEGASIQNIQQRCTAERLAQPRPNWTKM